MNLAVFMKPEYFCKIVCFILLGVFSLLGYCGHNIDHENMDCSPSASTRFVITSPPLKLTDTESNIVHDLCPNFNKLHQNSLAPRETGFWVSDTKNMLFYDLTSGLPKLVFKKEIEGHMGGCYSPDGKALRLCDCKSTWVLHLTENNGWMLIEELCLKNGSGGGGFSPDSSALWIRSGWEIKAFARNGDTWEQIPGTHKKQTAPDYDFSDDERFKDPEGGWSSDSRLLWLRIGNRLQVYEKNRGWRKFTGIDTPEAFDDVDPVIKFSLDESLFWLVARNKIIAYEKYEGKWKLITDSKMKSGQNDFVLARLSPSQNKFIVGTENRVKVFQKKTEGWILIPEMDLFDKRYSIENQQSTSFHYGAFSKDEKTVWLKWGHCLAAFYYENSSWNMIPESELKYDIKNRGCGQLSPDDSLLVLTDNNGWVKVWARNDWGWESIPSALFNRKDVETSFNFSEDSKAFWLASGGIIRAFEKTRLGWQKISEAELNMESEQSTPRRCCPSGCFSKNGNLMTISSAGHIRAFEKTAKGWKTIKAIPSDYISKEKLKEYEGVLIFDQEEYIMAELNTPCCMNLLRDFNTNVIFSSDDNSLILFTYGTALAFGKTNNEWKVISDVGIDTSILGPISRNPKGDISSDGRTLWMLVGKAVRVYSVHDCVWTELEEARLKDNDVIFSTIQPGCDFSIDEKLMVVRDPREARAFLLEDGIWKVVPESMGMETGFFSYDKKLLRLNDNKINQKTLVIKNESGGWNVNWSTESNEQPRGMFGFYGL